MRTGLATLAMAVGIIAGHSGGNEDIPGPGGTVVHIRYWECDKAWWPVDKPPACAIPR